MSNSRAFLDQLSPFRTPTSQHATQEKSDQPGALVLPVIPVTTFHRMALDDVSDVYSLWMVTLLGKVYDGLD